MTYLKNREVSYFEGFDGRQYKLSQDLQSSLRFISRYLDRTKTASRTNAMKQGKYKGKLSITLPLFLMNCSGLKKARTFVITIKYT